MSIRNLFASLSLFGVLAFGSAAYAGSLNDPQQPPQESSDSEDDIADEPQEVSGAF
jgi:hypothetical protein